MLQTSPEILADVENMLRRRYPTAMAPADSIANAASPFTPEPLRLFFSNSMAHTMVTGITKVISLERLITAAIAIAPKAT